jgi:PAS domain S-box-containing protein
MLGNACLESMRTLANCILEAVCAVDENGIVVIWNERAEKLYNIAKEEILERHITEFFPYALLETVRQTKIAQENISHMPNEKSHILISATPLFMDGAFRGVVSIDRDYAKVMQLYADLEKAQAKLMYLEGEIKKSSSHFGSSIIGNDANFKNRLEVANQIAATNTNVMITGESGTGKEVFARGIHELSGREGLFVPLNCSAIPSELFESEFFGYVSGAFTGASRKGKAGFFELANGGTIFLDEIGEMPFAAQAKLLRVLQEREVVRVGGGTPIKLDVRVISATNRNLKEMMVQDRFREDLYYRLNVVEIDLPPLRSRRQDIPLLISHFVAEFARRNSKKFTAVHPEAMRILTAYSWPGNIRELMNVLENMVVTCRGKVLESDNIPAYMLERATRENMVRQYPMDLAAATRELEREKITSALKTSKNNKSKAASLLNIPRATLYNKMDEYGIPR